MILVFEGMESRLTAGVGSIGEPASLDHSNTSAARPLLTVIVPAYNEARTVEAILQKVLDTPVSKQIIVVDDASSDGTLNLLKPFAADGRVEVLCHTENRGKGAAIHTALRHARGRYTIIQDADLEYDPSDYPRLLEPILSGKADVVFGSRYLRQGTYGRQPWRLFRIGVCGLNWVVRCLYGVRLTDEATCYKLFSTQALRAMDLGLEGFEFCPEVTAKACRMGLRIVEVPVSYFPRTAACGKKIRLRDGYRAVTTLLAFRRWYHRSAPHPRAFQSSAQRWRDGNWSRRQKSEL